MEIDRLFESFRDRRRAHRREMRVDQTLGVGPVPGAVAKSNGVVESLTAKVHAMTGNVGYTIRQAAYDLRKLRGKELITKPGRTRRYHLSPQTAGTIAALLTLREHVLEPILAGVRSPRRDANRPPGPTSTATTRRSASTCRRSCATWASKPPHRQHLVGQSLVSA